MTAQLHIETGLRANKTYLSDCYFTTPYKVADITEDRSENKLHLMLMSSSPGILDGDKYNVKIGLAENTSLQLQTQSYQRLFNMKKGALQSIEVRMSEGSSFTYLPHPTVPHKASNFFAANNIYLSQNCRLIWGEVLTCGRKLTGEEFAFSKFHSITKVFLKGKLMVKENLLIEPCGIDVHAIGQLEGYTHQASLIFIGEADVSSIISYINNNLNDEENICFGVSSLPVNGLIIRIMGFKAEQLFTCLKSIGNHLSTIRISDNIKVDKMNIYAS